MHANIDTQKNVDLIQKRYYGVRLSVFGHYFREIDGNRLICCMLIMVIADTI